MRGLGVDAGTRSALVEQRLGSRLARSRGRLTLAECLVLFCMVPVAAGQDAGSPGGPPEPPGQIQMAAEALRSQAGPGEVVTFERIVELALASNSVRAAEAQLEVARAALEAARAPLSATASVEARTTTDFSGPGTSVDLELGVNAALRTGWGASGEAAAAARRAVEATEAAVEAARADAVQRSLRFYSEVLNAEAAREIAQVRLEIARLQADAARERNAAGAVLAAEVARAELDEASAELELRIAEGEVAAAHASLSLELGAQVTEVRAGLPLGAAPGAELTDQALAARADVSAARRELEAAADALAQALRASGINLAGNVSVAGSSGGTSLSLAGGIDSRDRTPTLSGRVNTSTGPASAGAPAVRASVGVSVTVPLSPPDGRVAAAEAAYAQAEARLKDVVARAHLEVTALAAQAEANAERLRVARARAALAQAAGEAASARFELGVVNRVEVLQSQVAALQADSAVTAAESAYLQGLMALARALGRPVTEVVR